MRLNKALKDKMMDVRIRDKQIDEGKITKAEVAKVEAALPDDASNVASIEEVDSNTPGHGPSLN
ncbi:MAG: hypothetical protein E2O68_01035 [Deltaproteobacteria bacterium]|nr:MAG: hypothetical protein E2O68_01035 [Deltaproteobacteria bacterium]